MTLPSGLRNPFLGNIVDDPWRTASVSVSTIHQAVFDRCWEAVEFVRERSQSASVLIHGEPGSGKTHLLSRLRERAAEDNAKPSLEENRHVFISVRLTTSPSRIWRHVRQCFVDDLLRLSPNNLTQLEQAIATRLAKEIPQEGDMALCWDYMLEEDQAQRLQKFLGDWIMEANGSSALLRVLLRLLHGQNRIAARAWLRGEMLPESDLESLGLPKAQDDDEMDVSPENEAKEVVLALCRLIGPGAPIIFCFDQVEGLQHVSDDNAGLLQFGQLVSVLHDETHHAVLISCVQSSYLEKVRKFIPQADQARLQSYISKSLDPLLEADATQLVAARLASLLELASHRPTSADPLWPLSATDIQKIVGDKGCTPRALISLCANRFIELQGGTVEEKPVEDFLPEIWEQRINAAQKNKPDQTESILADALPLLLSLAEFGQKWKVEQDPNLRDVNFVLQGPDGEQVGVSFCTHANMISLSGHLRRLLEGGDWKKFPRRILLRDVRTPISKNATLVQQRLEKLQEEGAIFSRPNAEVIAALDALRRLIADADSGDLAVDGKTVDSLTLQNWLKENLAKSLQEFADVLIGEKSSEFHELGFEEPEFVWDPLIELLRTRHVLTLAEAAQETGCSEAEIERAVKSDQQIAGFLQGPPAVLFEIAETEISEDSPADRKTDPPALSASVMSLPP